MLIAARKLTVMKYRSWPEPKIWCGLKPPLLLSRALPQGGAMITTLLHMHKVEELPRQGMKLLEPARKAQRSAIHMYAYTIMIFVYLPLTLIFMPRNWHPLIALGGIGLPTGALTIMLLVCLGKVLGCQTMC